jgi:hypothetical protein
MGKGGAIRKLILGGVPIELSSDNDPNMTKGGVYVTEKQDTTGKPFFLLDKINAVLAGAEARVSHQDGTFTVLDDLMQDSALSPISALIEMADGAKYTASDGVVLIPDNLDGMLSIREGKLPFSVHPASDKWLPA